MRATLTFNNVYDSDINLTGSVGLDLTKAYRLSKRVPPSFIITTSVFNECLDKGLTNAIKNIMVDGVVDQSSLLKVFSAYKLPKDMLKELKEAYESLNVDESSNILKEGEPLVNLFLSPDYYFDYDFSASTVLNIKGFDNFIDAVKSLWIKLYSRDAFMYRKKNGIQFFSTAIIVQKTIRQDASVEVLTHQDRIFANAYKGLPDLTKKISKDKITIDLSSLDDFDVKVSSQEFKIVPHDTSGGLLKSYLKGSSTQQKISNQAITELSRLIKKIRHGFSSEIKALFAVRKDFAYLLYIHTLPGLNFDVKNEESVEEFDLPKAKPEMPKNPNEPSPVDKLDDVDNSKEELPDFHDDEPVATIDEEPKLEVEQAPSEPQVRKQPDPQPVKEAPEPILAEEDRAELIDFSYEPEEGESTTTKMETIDSSPVHTAKLDNEHGDEHGDEHDDDFLISHESIDDEEKNIYTEQDEPDKVVDLEGDEDSALVKLYDEFEGVVSGLYKDSYGFDSEDISSALMELNNKYSLKHFEDLLDFNELMLRRKKGHNIDSELLDSTVESVKEFIKENA